MSMFDEDPEAKAICLFTSFLRENKELLQSVAHWGDGKCGELNRIMVAVLMEPAPKRGGA